MLNRNSVLKFLLLQIRNKLENQTHVFHSKNIKIELADLSDDFNDFRAILVFLKPCRLIL